MKSLPRIPTPPAQKWREFRIQVLPIFVFAGALVLTVLIWNHNVAAPTLQGEVESLQANVISTQGGLISDIRVERFQRVEPGDIIALISPLEPERLKSALAVINTDLQMMRARMLQDRDRNELNYERLRLDHLTARTELGINQLNLQNLEREFQRIERLYEDRLVSEEIFDSIRTARTAQQIEVQEQEQLVAQMQQTIELFQRPESQMAAVLEAVENAIQAQEEQLNYRELIVAPMSGTVSMLYRRPGEKLMAGEPVATLSPDKAEFILGYLRQPVRVEPEPGMQVRVRTRGLAKRAALTRVYRVGSSMEEIAMSLRLRGWESLPEKGLPVLVHLPPELPVKPGEVVDLILLPRKSRN
jgi:multidrug resistance efflux pump